MQPFGSVNSLKTDLADWYYQNYFSFKQGHPATMNNMAERYADTVLETNWTHRVDLEGHMSNVLGCLGEIMAVSSLNLISQRHYSHELSTKDQDNLGWDINTYDGVADPILGYGVKLSKYGQARVVNGFPVMNIRFDPQDFYLFEFVRQQAKGHIMKPRTFVEGLFCNPGVKDKFHNVLTRQAGSFIKEVNPLPGNPEYEYLRQYVA